jgi:hypothetical protein
MIINAKARLHAFAPPPELPAGVYVSKEKPAAAEVSEGTKAHRDAFVWSKEDPKMLVRIRKVGDLMKYLPGIFGRYDTAKLDPKLSSETNFLFLADGVWLLISLP